MKVVFTTAARLELASIFVWLEPRRPAAAERLLRQIEQLKQNLVEFPYMGRRKYRSDVRIMPIHGFPYIAYYRVKGDMVEILSIRHTSRRPPQDPDFS